MSKETIERLRKMQESKNTLRENETGRERTEAAQDTRKYEKGE